MIYPWSTSDTWYALIYLYICKANVQPLWKRPQENTTTSPKALTNFFLQAFCFYLKKTKKQKKPKNVWFWATLNCKSLFAFSSPRRRKGIRMRRAANAEPGFPSTELRKVEGFSIWCQKTWVCSVFFWCLALLKAIYKDNSGFQRANPFRKPRWDV